MQPLNLPAGVSAQGSGRAAGAALGRIRENLFTPPLRVDPETGEIEGLARDHKHLRAERWALKSAANVLLPPGHRTSKCHRWRVPEQELQVLRGAEIGRAFYHGLQVCASVWACPVCAAKISERRRVECACAIAAAQALGMSVYLLTLTVPHGLGDDLPAMLDAMTKAWTKLYQGKSGERLRQALGLKGTIRALEVTTGVNGWHPHFHALLFLDGGLTPAEVQQILTPRWQAVAQSCGLPCPSNAHGCRVDDGQKAAAYIAKGSTWGLESELTKGHQKRGRSGQRTPWDLLRDYLAGDKQAGALFRAYAEAFHGRRQLYWSNGLKARLGIGEISDEELANKPEEVPALLLARITDDQWRAVLRLHFEAVLLDLAETDPDGLRAFLNTLEHRRCTPHSMTPSPVT